MGTPSVIMVLVVFAALTTGIRDHCMGESYSICPIGRVIQSSGEASIEILPQFKDALLGIGHFSHIIVLYWFDRNDTPEKRATLQVHPRGDNNNPLSGVFATRSPFRPNPVGFSVCKIKSLEPDRIVVHQIDAFDRTPVIDIKPYIPEKDSVPDASRPEWVKRQKKK